MIKIYKIETYSLPIYFNNTKIGECNTLLEFNNVRCQIAKEHINGYSFKFKNKIYSINSDGIYDTINDPEFYSNIDNNIFRDILISRINNKNICK